jgi:hypothetical protein
MYFSTPSIVFSCEYIIIEQPRNQGLGVNISVISWWSVLLVEEAGFPRENHRHAAGH